MSAGDARTFRLAHDTARQLAMQAVKDAPDGWVVRVSPPARSLDQNAKFHAACSDIAKAKPEWNGQRMTGDDWKALLIVSHAIATSETGATRLVPDLEGSGLVQLRESSARMSKARASSLIEYVTAWATTHGIQIRENGE